MNVPQPSLAMRSNGGRNQEFELAVGEVRFGGVAATLGFGIAGEMLGAGQNRILGERLASFGAALIALDGWRRPSRR